MLETLLSESFQGAYNSLYGRFAEDRFVTFTRTRAEFEGDMTIVVFPFTKSIGKSPDVIANEIGQKMIENQPMIKSYNVVKGFLNLVISDSYWIDFLNKVSGETNFGKAKKNGKKVVVEYSSPNTNKPLHLGHIRNNLLGWSVSEILKANGTEVVKVNLVNDRGIHICKSMIAWQKWGKQTPEEAGMKGDKLVGAMYVAFDKELKKQTAVLEEQDLSQDEAMKQAPIMMEAQEMLRKWEAGDPEIRSLWQTMNAWVYAGFDETYRMLGVDFDKFYYESDTYLLGKSLVMEALDKNILYRKADNSIWCDLTSDGLDEKLLLRSDGTSVYMTQDLGTAEQRHAHYQADQMIYVVGNEQNYHFDVLKLILKKMGRKWADGIVHLSYGMVELPDGKMKSREGTVVDADDLMADMIATAKQKTEELGKSAELETAEAENLYRQIGLGALKYFILKVDPKKTILFNPAESIDFNGNTGPFIQYTHARIRSLLRKAEAAHIATDTNVHAFTGGEKEKQLIKLIHQYPVVLGMAAETYSPALIANYLYDLAKEFNQFYQAAPILREENEALRLERLKISLIVANTIRSAGNLLGIEMPDKM